LVVHQVQAGEMQDASTSGAADRPLPGAAATTGASVLRGGAWYALSQFLPQAYTLALSVIAARFLGPAGMGRQSYIAFVAVAITGVLTSSLSLALMRYVGETIGRGGADVARGLLFWAWKVEGIFAAAAAAGFTGAALAGAKPEGAWALAGAVSALGIMHTVPTAVLVGLQRFREASIAGLTTGALGVGATAGVLAAGGGITGMFAVEAAAAALNLVWTSTLALNRLQLVAPRSETSHEVQRLITRYALISALGVILELIVSRRSEVFFLERYSTESQIAFYSIAFAAVAALVQIPRALATAVLPAFATLYGAGADEQIRLAFSRGLRLLLLATMPVLALSVVAAPRLLELVYGSAYSGTRPVLLILLAGIAFIPTASLSNSLLAGMARVQVPLLANAAAAVVDVGLAVALIPSFDAVGAALANIGGLLTYGAVVNLSTARLARPIVLEPRSLGRGAVAAGLAGLSGWAVMSEVAGLLGLIAACVVIIAVYAGLARTLRILPRGDAFWLDVALGHHLGGRVGRVCKLCARES
jgi:O-antigen/teichoic acid export membrane protein